MLDGLLSPAAADLYERIVDGSDVRVDANNADDVEDLLARELLQLGLVKVLPADENRLLPVEPIVALGTGVRPLLERVLSSLDAANQVVLDMNELQARFSRARRYSAGRSTAITLYDKTQIATEHAAMQDRATREILSFTVNTRLTGVTPAVLVSTEVQQEQGVVARTIFDANCLPQLQHVVVASIRAGELARIAAQLPIKMKIVDRREALVGLDETGLRAALYVREPAFISALCRLFESEWERAVPYAAASADDSGVTAREREVLVLLATGDKDETIAKKLGVGVRTVRRHISSAMQKLGTESRFAAGVQAVKRGWL